MVFTSNDLKGWKDFPKGIRVLLLDEDNNSAAVIKSKLEEMDYIVHTFCNENEALSAISNKVESFHVAIVEVNSSNSDGGFKFLETAKDLPTIMTSKIQCFSTMMKCIALGAVEFLHKPLSEDKLRNIWQHVVHKAFSADCNILPGSLPIKESVASLLQLHLENREPETTISVETGTLLKNYKTDVDQPTVSDKCPAPSTPQLTQGSCSLDDGDCHGKKGCSAEKERGEQDGEPKFVENTCGNSNAEVTIPVQQPQSGDTVIKHVDESADGSKGDSHMFPRPRLKSCEDGSGKPSKSLGISNLCGIKAHRKKLKVDWTPELHKKFVEAVEKLGVNQAIPSRILELMKVDGLTRHNVASHLQKYRMQRRHILPKSDDRRWAHPRVPSQRSYYHKPIMAFPRYYQAPPIGPVWGAPDSHPPGVQMCGPPSYPPWHWKPYPGLYADVWGCPVMPPPHVSCYSFTQNVPGFANGGAVDNNCNIPNSLDFQPASEVIDNAVKEAISKPWLPLPLGLNPPSTESVMLELTSLGFTSIPSSHQNH